MSDTRSKMRAHRLAHGGPTGRVRRTAKRVSGIRPKDAGEMIGVAPNALSQAARRGLILKMDDGSLDVSSFEAWVRAHGDPTFVVPAGRRGLAFEESSDVAVGPEPWDLGNSSERGLLAKSELLRHRIELRLQRANIERQGLIVLAASEELILAWIDAFCDAMTAACAGVGEHIAKMDDDWDINHGVGQHFLVEMHRFSRRPAAILSSPAPLTTETLAREDNETVADHYIRLRSVDDEIGAKLQQQLLAISKRTWIPVDSVNYPFKDLYTRAQRALERVGTNIARTLADLDDPDRIERYVLREVDSILSLFRRDVVSLFTDLGS